MVFCQMTWFWGSTVLVEHLPPYRPLVQLHGFTSTPTSPSLTADSTLHTQRHQVRKNIKTQKIYESELNIEEIVDLTLINPMFLHL